MFENNFIASASDESVKRIGTFCFFSLIFSINSSANNSASSFLAPTITLDGNKLSFKDCPSRKNSGENIIFLVLNFFFNFSVCPTGTVDFIMIVAKGLILIDSSITESTTEVLKLFESGS